MTHQKGQDEMGNVHCETCGVVLTDAEEEGAVTHECPPGFQDQKGQDEMGATVPEKWYLDATEQIRSLREQLAQAERLIQQLDTNLNFGELYAEADKRAEKAERERDELRAALERTNA